jgi:TetR/AcrR family transcriptional regulator, cholesterol catabolism regulator
VQAEILTAAADRFRDRGYRATTLDEIARHVGMSKATLYGYFRSKEQLLAAIFHRTMTLFEQELLKIRESGLSPDEELRRVIRHHVRTVIAERSFLTVFFGEEAHLPRQLRRAITRRKARYDTTLLAIVQAALAGHASPVAPPRLLVFALLGMSNWVYTWYRPGGPWSPDAVADAFIALIERGYRPSPAWAGADLVATLGGIERELAALRTLAGAAAVPAAATDRARPPSAPRGGRSLSRP